MSASPYKVSLARPIVGAQIQDLAPGVLVRSLEQERLQAAEERAHQAGYSEAMQSAAQALNLAAERLDQAREQATALLRAEAVDLAVEIARQLVQVEIAAENYDLERIVRMSLAHSGLGRGSAVVHVSPGDHERMAEITFRAGTELKPDPKIAPGDVQVEGPRGLLVREIEASLDSIREQLLEDLA